VSCICVLQAQQSVRSSYFARNLLVFRAISMQAVVQYMLAVHMHLQHISGQDFIQPHENVAAFTHLQLYMVSRVTVLSPPFVVPTFC
jgi:hypothetical protein